MADRDAHLHGVLDGYAKFLQDKDLALDKHQPHLVRWVRDFLLFARAHGGYSFEQTLDLFLAEVGGRVGTKPWQLQQASAAIRIYRYQYRGAKAEDDDGPTVSAFVDDAARLERLREVIRDARGQALFLVSAPVLKTTNQACPQNPLRSIAISLRPQLGFIGPASSFSKAVQDDGSREKGQ